MRHSKQAFIVILTFVICVFFGSFNMVQGAEKKMNLTIGTPFPPGTPAVVKGMDTFINGLKELTNGRVTAKCHYGGILGGEKQLMESLPMGSIQVALLTTGTLGNFFSIADVFNLPYIWRDYDHCYKAMAGEFGRRYRNAALEKGYRIFDTWRSGQRAFVSRKPVLTFDDMKGFKMRCMESKPYIEFYKACGSIPTPIPWPEVYTALQKGVVDGADTTLDVSITAKHIEVTKFGIAIDQSLMPCFLIVSEKWWKKLPKDIQEAFITSQKKAVAVNNKADIERQMEVVRIYQDRGLTVINPPLKPFRDAAHSIYSKFYSKIGKDNIDLALKAE